MIVLLSLHIPIGTCQHTLTPKLQGSGGFNAPRRESILSESPFGTSRKPIPLRAIHRSGSGKPTRWRQDASAMCDTMLAGWAF